jgi:hypothetical protein
MSTAWHLIAMLPGIFENNEFPRRRTEECQGNHFHSMQAAGN